MGGKIEPIKDEFYEHQDFGRRVVCQLVTAEGNSVTFRDPKGKEFQVPKGIFVREFRRIKKPKGGSR